MTCALNNRRADDDASPGSSSPFAANDSRPVVPVSSAAPSEFLCPYSVHCFALCMCCDFLACDCRMKCSDGCDCFHDQAWAANVIQCGRRGHPAVPEFIPMDATHLYLDGNRLGDLAGETFIGRKHLRELYLNSSRVEAISSRTLDGLSSLEVLSLRGNLLASLAGGDEFRALSSLRELDLSDNRLESVHPGSFDPLSSLRVLRLSGNRLATFPVWRLVDMPALASASLAGNPWSCRCDFLRPARALLRDRRDLLADADLVTCTAEGSAAAASAIGGDSCADVMAVSFRSGSSDGGGEATAIQVASVPGEQEAEDGGLLVGVVPILAVVFSALVIVGSLIVLAVAFRRPVSTW